MLETSLYTELGKSYLQDQYRSPGVIPNKGIATNEFMVQELEKIKSQETEADFKIQKVDFKGSQWVNQVNGIRHQSNQRMRKFNHEETKLKSEVHIDEIDFFRANIQHPL